MRQEHSIKTWQMVVNATAVFSAETAQLAAGKDEDTRCDTFVGDGEEDEAVIEDRLRNCSNLFLQK